MEHIVRSKHTEAKDGSRTWEETAQAPEGTYSRTVSSTPWVLNRTDCFCCSCQEDEYGLQNDPHCRNHGFDGERPCEAHNMTGAPTQAGTMPDSVQQHRKGHHE